MKASRFFGLIVVLTLLITLSQTLVRDSAPGLAAGTAFTVSAYDVVGNESGQGQGVLGFGENAQGATINAASCEQTDVQAAIDSASPEDTILVPPGSCTWTERLNITKGINLIGAGIGSTVIINGLSDHGYLISVDPSDYDRNDPIRISGFTFDLNNNGRGIHFGTYNKQAPFTINTKGRIDHNRFYNAPNPNTV